MDKGEQARACFGQGFSCSQAVFATYAPDFGIETDEALRIAAPFGGGIARTGGTCGALSGALMALGLKYGATLPDPAAKERTYEIARQFMERFRAANGAIDCRDLLGNDISTAAGRQAIKESGVTKTVCPRLVQSAAELLDETLAS